LLFGSAQVGIDADEMLALVFAEIKDFESAIVLALSFQLSLHADEPLAGGVDGELTEVADDPFTAELFGDGGGSARAAEKVGYEIAVVGRDLDDAFEQGFRLLCFVAALLAGPSTNHADIIPPRSQLHSFALAQIFLLHRNRAGLCLNDQSCIYQLLHSLF
jgi:hypothetical protein